jgi:2'-5' RNA ligase
MKALTYASRQYVEDVKEYSTIIVALKPQPEIAEALAIEAEGAVPPGEMHVTLTYLGETDALSERKNTLLAVVESVASDTAPFDCRVNGYSRFINSENDDDHASVLSIGCPELDTLHTRLIEAFAEAGFLVDRTYGFSPHITLAYTDLTTPTVLHGPWNEPESLRFDRLYVFWGDGEVAFSLGTSVRVSDKTYSRSQCMNCSKPPTVEVLWAKGMGRAWFCDACYAAWENKEDVVATHKVVDGVVPKEWAKKGSFITVDGRKIFVEDSFMDIVATQVLAIKSDADGFFLILGTKEEEDDARPTE